MAFSSFDTFVTGESRLSTQMATFGSIGPNVEFVNRNLASAAIAFYLRIEGALDQFIAEGTPRIRGQKTRIWKAGCVSVFGATRRDGQRSAQSISLAPKPRGSTLAYELDAHPVQRLVCVPQSGVRMAVLHSTAPTNTGCRNAR